MVGDDNVPICLLPPGCMRAAALRNDTVCNLSQQSTPAPKGGERTLCMLFLQMRCGEAAHDDSMPAMHI